MFPIPGETAWSGSGAIAELRFRPEPLRQYLGHIVASFLANPPATPPDDYRHRPVELELARQAEAE